jgi:hypothetical protein
MEGLLRMLYAICSVAPGIGGEVSTIVDVSWHYAEGAAKGTNSLPQSCQLCLLFAAFVVVFFGFFFHLPSVDISLST